MILVNFCIAVCIQGLLFCPISSPLQAESLAKAYGEYKNAHILDHTVLKDSELMLIEREGDVQILELQRNLFFQILAFWKRMIFQKMIPLIPQQQ